jgi:DNA-binding HxlR family transcriptional regulator
VTNTDRVPGHRRGVTVIPVGAAQGAQRCSVLGALTILGDFWALGIVRCAFFGMSRFAEFQKELGASSNVLSDRLAGLVEAGVLVKRVYQERPVRHRYELTAAGHELAPVIHGLKRWGDRHVQPDGAWAEVRHVGCAGSAEVGMFCPQCDARLEPGDLETVWLRQPPS